MTAATAHASLCQRQFVQLTTPHMPRLFRIGMRLTHQDSEAKDLVQEALTRAWANWSRFDTAGSLGAWLSRILMNVFISRHRHQKVVSATASRPDVVRHLFDPNRVEHAERPEAALTTDFSDEVVDALATLPAHYREAVELVDIRGMAYKEAADELNCPLGTVMSRLHRARRLLRDQLSAYALDYGIAA